MPNDDSRILPLASRTCSERSCRVYVETAYLVKNRIRAGSLLRFTPSTRPQGLQLELYVTHHLEEL